VSFHMITITVELVLAALLVIVLMNIFKKKPAPPPAPAAPVPDLANLGPADARTGDAISISGAGDQMTDLDFTIERHSDGTLWFTPARSGVTMMLYSSQPVADLTSIDRAAATGFNAVNMQAVPGYAYVFRVMKSDGVHFAALRVAFVTPDYVVFDWSYQSGVGNAELSRMGGD